MPNINKQLPPAKKQWQKPEIYLLDSTDNVNGGASNSFHEKSIISRTIGGKGHVPGHVGTFTVDNFIS